MSGKKWRLGLAGCGWIAGVYAEACKALPQVEITACCASGAQSARTFAERHGIPHPCQDTQELVARDDVDVVCVLTPNYLHHSVCTAALQAGRHVIVEKPLTVTLEQAEQVVRLAHERGLIVGYAENLCFAPKYVKARELIQQGALGEVRFLSQVEKHDGPHSRWFYTPALAGGGALFDMGCHSIELVRWLLGKPPVTQVWAHMDTWLHKRATELEDHAVIHLEFEGGASALLEAGWTLKGGMASRLEIQGTQGVLRTQLLQEGMGMQLYSESSEPLGWRSVDNDWSCQNGYPQELAHFLHCCETGEKPEESAEDGLLVLELVLAAYHSAGTGQKVKLPYRPSGVELPYRLWREPTQ